MPDRQSKAVPDPQAVRIEGLEFVEFAAPDPAPLVRFIEQLGFRAVARHRSKDVTLYRQGEINFIVNATPGSFAQSHAEEHGASICALALRVADATTAFQKLLAAGAWESNTTAGVMELNIPAIESLGGTQIYLVDRYGEDLSIYDIDFKALPAGESTQTLLHSVRALTLAVCPGRTPQWRDFFCQLFGFVVQAPDELRSPDGGLLLKLREIDGTDCEVADEGIGAIHLCAADLVAAGKTLAASGLQPQAGVDGQLVIGVPDAKSPLNIIIGRE